MRLFAFSTGGLTRVAMRQIPVADKMISCMDALGTLYLTDYPPVSKHDISVSNLLHLR
jgi:hypothetical protein